MECWNIIYPHTDKFAGLNGEVTRIMLVLVLAKRL